MGRSVEQCKNCLVPLIRTRVGAAIDIVNRPIDTDLLDLHDWHRATGLLGRDDAIVEVADQLGDQRVKVSKTCCGYYVWIKDRSDGC